MRLLLATLTTLLLTLHHAQAANPSPSHLNSQPDGWVNLLQDGLKNWYRVPVPPTGELGRAHWHYDAPSQLLICDGDGGHDMLLFEKPFTNHIFHLEFRYTQVEDLKGYNSGAYIRNSPGGTIWHQAQFGDAQDGFLFGVTPTPNGDNKFFSTKKDAQLNHIKPAGEWNTLEITAQDQSITLWVNGTITCSLENCLQPAGFLGVEAEGYRIEFRNLLVKTLP